MKEVGESFLTHAAIRFFVKVVIQQKNGKVNHGCISDLVLSQLWEENFEWRGDCMHHQLIRVKAITTR